MADSPPEQARPVPSSVSYARFLLYLQGIIWGLTCIVAVLLALHTKSATPGGSPLVHEPALAFGAASLAAALAGAKVWLGGWLSRRAGASRQTVIVVECMMAGFGAAVCLLTANLDGGVIPFYASFVGGILSLIAAIGLMRPPARQYFARPWSDFTPTNPTLGPGDGGQGRSFTINAQTRRKISVPLACH